MRCSRRFRLFRGDADDSVHAASGDHLHQAVLRSELDQGARAQAHFRSRRRRLNHLFERVHWLRAERLFPRLLPQELRQLQVPEESGGNQEPTRENARELQHSTYILQRYIYIKETLLTQ